jgi:hypothetical protein
MSHATLETFLARLYTDPEALKAFLEAPEAVLARSGLSAEDQRAALKADRVGLRMAARSFAHKRSRKAAAEKNDRPGRWSDALRRLLFRRSRTVR